MSEEHTKPQESGEAPLHGYLASYDGPAALIAASKKVRDAGFKKWDTFTPYPVHGIDPAMGIKPTILPWLVLGAALTGLTTAILLQWWTNAVDYPFLISGKPFWSIPANVPVMFELTVLFSVFASLFGMLALNGLPHPSHPLDLKKHFARSTDDRFFLLIEAADPKFDDARTRGLLEATSPLLLEDVLEDRVTSNALPKIFIYGGIIAVIASLIPFGLALKARQATSATPRVHLIQDMDSQPKYKGQRQNPFFADQRAMREPVADTIAVGQLQEDDHFYRGKEENEWARTFPKQIDASPATMERGKTRFTTYCSPCHGASGNGEGMVHQRASALGGPWIQPTDIAQKQVVDQPVGQLFDVITHGVRNMPAYGPQIDVEDRWAIVMYLRALQRQRAEGSK